MAEQVFVNCTQGGPVLVHVDNGKIIRVRPLAFQEDEEVPGWTIEAHGRKFSAPRKVTVAPYVLTERAKAYSEDRIQYPLKRIDFDPKGERHPENRGKSGYTRISWDEALDLVAAEMKRIRTRYGPEAIMSKTSSHHEWGCIGYKFKTWGRFFQLLGFTDILDNPDSWEGWHWGAAHVFGFYWRLGIPEQCDLLEDGLKHTEMIVHWGNDPDSTFGAHGGQDSAIWRLWLRELGKRQVFIDPYCNYTAVTMGDRWIAPRPGTDSALALAISHVWINEGTYDKDYIAKRTYGFAKYQGYVTGQDDGIPKTPEWAELKCGVPARVIRALAREWASKRTSVAAGCRGGWGGACRGAYATEWARLMVLLQAMQGLGKPGVSIWGTATGAPINVDFYFPGYAAHGYGMNNIARKPALNSVTQRVYRPLVPEAILNPPIHWRGEGFNGKSLEQQFKPYTYPEPGRSEVKMFFRYGGSFIGTMTNTNRWVKMYQSPKLEFVVNQDVWWCNETGFADVILPACSNFERNDISEWAQAGGYSPNSCDACNHRIIIYQQKCIEPLYESRSDYWILSRLAERLGFIQDFTEGNSEEDWIEKTFYASDTHKYISFADFKKKGYFLVPFPENQKYTPALRWFYEGRECDTIDRVSSKTLGSYTGKIEFESQSLKKHFPQDDERPPVPHYIPSWEGHESEMAREFPLQLISPHPRFSYHTHHDNHVEWIGEIPQHRIFKDGNYWRTVRIHPQDASNRHIQNGDIVRLFNSRGAMLGIAQITERIKPGVIHSCESSARYEPLEPGKPGSTDRGGCINLLTPERMLSRNASGMAPNSCLIEIAKWEV